MNYFVKTISASVDSMSRRVIKFLRFGKSDVQTGIEALAYGLDSNPIKDMVAVYAETSEKGKVAIVGYLNKNQKAQPGEFRTFCTDSQGVEKFYTWMKSDGTIEIGGNVNFAVKYNELVIEFNKIKTDFNSLVSIFNAHTHILALSSGTGTAAPSITQGTVNTSDITQTKNSKIKTI